MDTVPRNCVRQKHRGQVDRDHAAVIQFELLGKGLTLVGARARRTRRGWCASRPSPSVPNNPLNSSSGWPIDLAGFQTQNALGGGVEQGDPAVVVGDHHAIRHRFQDGARTAGLDLLFAQHTAQVLGLIADQVEQLGIVERDADLPGGSFHQAHLVRR